MPAHLIKQPVVLYVNMFQPSTADPVPLSEGRGSTPRALRGVEHSRAGPPPFAQQEAVRVASSCLRGSSGSLTPSAILGPIQSEVSRSSAIWHVNLAFALMIKLTHDNLFSDTCTWSSRTACHALQVFGLPRSACRNQDSSTELGAWMHPHECKVCQVGRRQGRFQSGKLNCKE